MIYYIRKTNQARKIYDINLINICITRQKLSNFFFFGIDCLKKKFHFNNIVINYLFIFQELYLISHKFS